MNGTPREEPSFWRWFLDTCKTDYTLSDVYEKPKTLEIKKIRRVHKKHFKTRYHSLERVKKRKIKYKPFSFLRPLPPPTMRRSPNSHTPMIELEIRVSHVWRKELRTK